MQDKRNSIVFSSLPRLLNASPQLPRCHNCKSLPSLQLYRELVPHRCGCFQCCCCVFSVAFFATRSLTLSLLGTPCPSLSLPRNLLHQTVVPSAITSGDSTDLQTFDVSVHTNELRLVPKFRHVTQWISVKEVRKPGAILPEVDLQCVT